MQWLINYIKQNEFFCTLCAYLIDVFGLKKNLWKNFENRLAITNPYNKQNISKKMKHRYYRDYLKVLWGGTT